MIDSISLAMFFPPITLQNNQKPLKSQEIAVRGQKSQLSVEKIGKYHEENLCFHLQFLNSPGVPDGKLTSTPVCIAPQNCTPSQNSNLLTPGLKTEDG